MKKPEHSREYLDRRGFFGSFLPKEDKPTNKASSSSLEYCKGLISDVIKMGGVSVFATYGWSLFSELLFRISSVDDELKDLFERSDVISVNGMDVQFISVAHAADNFFTRRQEYKELVARAPFVVLEYFPDFIQKNAKPQTKDEELLAGKDILSQIGNYFAAIGRECARMGKDILVVNPHQASIGAQLLETYLALGLPTALMLTDVGKLVNRIWGNRVTRRHFLRTVGYGAAFSELASWVDIINQNADTLQHEGSFQRFRWNTVDFRDLRSAQGLQRISQTAKTEPGDIVPVIQGGAHFAGTSSYLKDPQLADLKIKLYKHYDIFSNPILRYIYNHNEDKWELNEEIYY